MSDRAIIDTDLLCMFCRRPEDEHGPPGEGFHAHPTDRLCPVPGVTSQYFYSKARQHHNFAVRAANEFRQAKYAATLQTQNAFPLGCEVHIQLETCQIIGTVHAQVVGFPDRIACYLENGNVWDYPIEKVTRVHTTPTVPQTLGEKDGEKTC